MKEKIDEITKKVEDMYKKYPYPSPSTDPSQTNELLNLLKIFELESSIKLEGKNILDAGTGSGHRITNVAEFYKKSNFLGIDVSEKSLQIAKQLIKQKKITNLKLENINLMNEFSKIGKFDIILCMGVLHHLSNPEIGLKNIKNVLEKDGIIFLYLYGKLGGHTRMLNKKIISTLLGKNNSDYEKGIKIARELNFNNFEYGWNLNFKNKKEEDALIVDYLLHANEILYDLDDIEKLLKKSKLYGYAVFGITTGTEGLLFDSRYESKVKLSIPQTNISRILKTKFSKKYYESLNLKEQHRVLELLYEPNGYTIIGFTKKAFENLTNKRLKENFIKI